jgi:hypothetical protein
MPIKWLAAQDRVRAAERRLAILREAAGRICVGILASFCDQSLLRKTHFLFDKITHIGYKFKLQGGDEVPMADSDSDYRVTPAGAALRACRPCWPMR